jgi:hypothetical protein
MSSGNKPTTLQTLTERYNYPAVRVMARELTHLAQEVEHGTLAWPASPPALAPGQPAIPHLEQVEEALREQRGHQPGRDYHTAWRKFAKVIRAGLVALPEPLPAPGSSEPHPAALIALRLLWGAEHFAELPTALLRPPPAPFLASLAALAPQENEATQLDLAVAAWLQSIRPESEKALPAETVQGFARMVAAFRAVGKLRKAVTLEDVAAGYLAWARLLHANLPQLVHIASGWWSSPERPSGRRQ